MKILIFGATGSIGSVITQTAVNAGHEVFVYVRNPSKLGALRDKTTVIQGELNATQLIDKAMQGIDVVISGLGMKDSSQAHADILIEGLKNIISSMEKNSVQRIITMNGAMTPVEGDQVTVFFRIIRKLMNILMVQVIRCHTGQLDALADSSLDWTVVRAGFVTNSNAAAEIQANANIQMGSKISRKNLAEFFIQQLSDDKFIKKAPIVVST